MFIYIYINANGLGNFYNNGCERSEVSVSERVEQALPDKWVPREKLYLGNESFWTYGAGNKKCLF